MSYLHNYLGLFGCLLILVAMPLVSIRQPRFNRKVVTIVMFAMMALAATPILGLPVVGYIRAGIGDLSITSMIMLCLFIASAYAGKPYMGKTDKHWLAYAILLCALIVYPLGLGLTLIDTYALGYGSILLFAPLLAAAIYLLWQQRYLLLTILLAGISAYLLNLLNSTNLWDYLFDPWIFFVALFRIVGSSVQRLKQSLPFKKVS